MKKLAFLILWLSTHVLSAQPQPDSLNLRDEYIINDSALNAGIYLSFEEFKYNSPTIREYTAKNNRFWITDPETGKRKRLPWREIWGYSTGKKVFVRWNKFNELTVMGRYCFFTERGVKYAYVVSVFPPMFVPFPYPYKDQVIINFNNGKKYRLTKRLFKHILKTDDPELLARFVTEEKKKSKFYAYIMEYNARNLHRIK